MVGLKGFEPSNGIFCPFFIRELNKLPIDLVDHKANRGLTKLIEERVLRWNTNDEGIR